MMSLSFEGMARQLSAPIALVVMAATLATVAAAGARWILMPTWSQYRSLRAEASAEALDAARAHANTLTAQATALEAELVDLRARVYGGSLEVEPRELEAWVIGQVDKISARNEVRLQSVAPEEPTHVLYFDERPYDVAVSGRYAAVYKWLGDVEGELRPMVLRRFDVSRDEQSGGVQVELRLVSYLPAEGRP